MTEYEQAMVAALERIAAAMEALAAEPGAQRAHEREQGAAVVEAIRMRQAVEEVAVEVEAAKPAEERVKGTRHIVTEALTADGEATT